MDWREQQSLLHQHSNIDFIYRRDPDTPVIERYPPADRPSELWVVLVCIFAMGVVVGMAL